MSDVTVHQVDPDELAEVVLETLEGVMETMTPDEGIHFGAGSAANVIEAKVPVMGDDPGTFTVRVPEPVAASMAIMWLGLEPAEATTEDACDAVSEFCNMLAGSAKTLVSAESALDVPQVTVVAAEGLVPLPGAVEVFHDLGVFTVDFSN